MKIGERWLKEIEPSDDIAAWVPVVAEIARGSKMKYALDKATGQLALHRALAGDLAYPTSYGFVVDTRGDDGMEVDMMILSAEPLLPLSIVKVRTVGGCTVHSEDKGEEHKLIGVAVDDPGVEKVRDLDDVPPELRVRVEHFYGEFKRNQGVASQLTAWFGRSEALDKLEGYFGGRARRKKA